MAFTLRTRFVCLFIICATAATPAAWSQGREAGEVADCEASVTVGYLDTLAAIAERCDTTVDALLAANPEVEGPRSLVVGSLLHLPDDETPARVAPRPQAERLYTVRVGDTIAEIAMRFGTSVPELRRLNPAIERTDNVSPGLTLTIPAPNTNAGPPLFDLREARYHGDDDVWVRVERLSPDETMRLILTRPGEDAIGLGRAHTDLQGNLSVEVELPDVALRSDRTRLVLLDADRAVAAWSVPFIMLPEE